MPRPRKPTAVLEMNGAFKHDPARGKERANEPKPTGTLGNPPSYFTAEQKKIWRELKKIAPPGVLTNADAWAVELSCVLMAKLRTGTIKPQELSILMSSLARLGMTPADRSRVAAAPHDTKKNDDWSDFATPAIAQ